MLITGSGNLTAGGLRWNIEAFNVTKLNAAEIKVVATQWEEYKTRCATNLLATDDPKVQEKLKQNGEKRATKPKAHPEAEAPEIDIAVAPVVALEDSASVDAVPTVQSESEVLVAEIPQSGNRWKQANFNLDTFVNFFGASKTKARRAYFFHVHADGTVGHQEVRPAVVVVSQNYRFELDAASGLPYPTNGRPIGVFVRVAARTFTYMLLMPNDPAHAAMDALLKAAKPVTGLRMRRVVFTAQAVQTAWPSSPLWQQLSI